MKVIIITQKEPFFIPAVLKSIIDKYKESLAAVVFLKPKEFEHKSEAILYYVRFWGIKQLTKFGFEFLKKSFQKLDLRGVNIIEDVDINSKDFIDKAREVDYIISIASNQIFNEELLSSPKEMCLNIHAGLLPDYKGYNPSFWVLFNDEKVTGITLHKIIKELDAGPIIMQEVLEIIPGETWFSLQNRVALKAGEMLNKIFLDLINKDLKLKEQNRKGSLFRKPKVNDGKDFRSLGKRFI